MKKIAFADYLENKNDFIIIKKRNDGLLEMVELIKELQEPEDPRDPVVEEIEVVEDSSKISYGFSHEYAEEKLAHTDNIGTRIRKLVGSNGIIFPAKEQRDSEPDNFIEFDDGYLDFYLENNTIWVCGYKKVEE